ncbi:MAG: hypothetical protein J0H62_05060, partial [Rhizobiales bacterium]|nr:hypothetical protein [Hyphomicrobiales bacterium]
MHTASAPPARVPPRRRRGRTVSAALALAVAFGALDVPAFIAGAPQQASAQERRFPFFDWGNSRQPERPQRRTPQPEPRRSVFPFFNWGGSEDSPRYRVYPDETERPVRRKPVAQNDPTRPPAPKKLEHEPAKTVLVFGDGMADWLSYGLEDAFEDPGEFGAVRKVRANTGLIQNEPRELDWVQNIRETFAKERADFVVMMIGLGDRHGIRERVAPRTGQPQPIDPTQQPNIMAPEAERAGKEQAEFRSDRWTELYAKRVAEVMNALKAKPV